MCFWRFVYKQYGGINYEGGNHLLLFTWTLCGTKSHDRFGIWYRQFHHSSCGKQKEQRASTWDRLRGSKMKSLLWSDSQKDMRINSNYFKNVLQRTVAHSGDDLNQRACLHYYRHSIVGAPCKACGKALKWSYAWGRLVRTSNKRVSKLLHAERKEERLRDELKKIKRELTCLQYRIESNI